MGLIHTHASKKRDRAEARLANAQRKQVKKEGAADQQADRQQAAEGQPWYRQPTLGAALTAQAAQKRAKHEAAGAANPSFREITEAGKMQRAAKRSGNKLTLDECIAAVREVNRADAEDAEGAEQGEDADADDE